MTYKKAVQAKCTKPGISGACFVTSGTESICTTEPKIENESVFVWKRECRVFAIKDSGAERFPAFQFSNGIANPIVKETLKNHLKG
ncbi:hypothetical protein NBRC116583_34810 [Arenicella sp. 4NH20-0111]